MDVFEALKELDLGPEATQEEIKQSYYDLVKVWHPDNYLNQPRLLLKAEEKLKKINQAKKILDGYTPMDHKARASKPKAKPDRGSQYREYQKPRDTANSNPQKSNTVTATGRPSIKKIIGIAIFIIFLLIRLVQYIDRHSSHSPTVESSAASTAPATPNPETSSYSKPTTLADDSPSPPDLSGQEPEQNNANDDACRNIIVDFINAEDTRNFFVISHYLSGRMERYWDLVQPTITQIYNRYRHVWNITAYSKNTIKHIDKINDTTYFVFTTFEYEGNKRHIVKTQESRLTFVFDQNNKIVQINGIVESEAYPGN
jgi:curved DNA-binding protein CbpA